MKPPRPHPFLAAEARQDGAGADALGAGSPADDPDALIVGLAADGGVSFRPGAAEGPAGIRAFSESIESYSPRCGRDLEDMTIADLGDHDDRASVEDVVSRILDRAWTDGSRPLLMCLGGDHSVTPPAVRAVASRVEGLAVVGFDAHLDLRESYPGDHACTYRRIAYAGAPCYVLGPRSGSRTEWRDAPGVLAYLSGSLEVPEPVLEELAGRPVYVTLDIDVLDPSAAPGTGNPEPGGPGASELLGAIEALGALDVVACDLVEVSPPLDPSGITQATAAVLVREMLLRFT